MELDDDLYTTLGISPEATADEVRQSRNRLLLHWHPDRSSDPRAVEHAKRINAAYDVLGDPERRAAYDADRASVGLGPGSISPVRPAPPSEPAPSPPRPTWPVASGWPSPAWTPAAPEPATDWPPPPEPAFDWPPETVGGGSEPSAVAWSAADPLRDSARQRLEDEYRAQAPPTRTWIPIESAAASFAERAPAAAWPESAGELRARGLRAAPFLALALVSWFAVGFVSHVAPSWLTGLLLFLSPFGIVAACRALLRRPSRFPEEGWLRFALAWIVGAILFVLVAQLVVGPYGGRLPIVALYLALLVAFAAGVGLVYGAARLLRRGAG
ncbi:MAG: DnaJ domain-containing protein [Candidatus Dormiibacterota bacterium]